MICIDNLKLHTKILYLQMENIHKKKLGIFHINFHSAGWLGGSALLVYGRCWVRISAGTSAILSEVSCGPSTQISNSTSILSTPSSSYHSALHSLGTKSVIK
jgi:hypothetical protein